MLVSGNIFGTIVRHPAVISYVAIDQQNNKLAGYIIGTTDSSKVTRLILQKLLAPLMWHGLIMLLLHPSQMTLVVKNFFDSPHFDGTWRRDRAPTLDQKQPGIVN